MDAPDREDGWARRVAETSRSNASPANVRRREREFRFIGCGPFGIAI
jgi:hypothetical protein